MWMYYSLNFLKSRGEGGGGIDKYPKDATSKQDLARSRHWNTYLLQRFSMAPLALQCAHLKHCRLTFHLYMFLCFYLFTLLIIIDYYMVDLLFTNTARLETRAFLCSSIAGLHTGFFLWGWGDTRAHIKLKPHLKLSIL